MILPKSSHVDLCNYHMFVKQCQIYCVVLSSFDFPETVLVAAVIVVAFDTDVSVGRTAVAWAEECGSADGIIEFSNEQRYQKVGDLFKRLLRSCCD